MMADQHELLEKSITQARRLVHQLELDLADLSVERPGHVVGAATEGRRVIGEALSAARRVLGELEAAGQAGGQVGEAKSKAK